jgi:hypothetical protein
LFYCAERRSRDQKLLITHSLSLRQQLFEE